MFALVSGAQLDASQTTAFSDLLASLGTSSNANNPQYARFLSDLQVAQAAYNEIRQQYAGQPLRWSDGEVIIAHGEPVVMFQVSEAQYQDGSLFGAVDSSYWGSGLDSPYSLGATVHHPGEMASIDSAGSADTIRVYDQAYWSAMGGGAEVDTTDVDIVLTLSGGGVAAKAAASGIRRLLQSRVGGVGKVLNVPAEDVAISIAPKIERQMGRRGWDRSSISETILEPRRKVSTCDVRHNPEIGRRNDDPATAYINSDGSYVVRKIELGILFRFQIVLILIGDLLLIEVNGVETDYLTMKNAVNFLHECESKRIFVFGVERFLCGDDGNFPDLDGIADFSSLGEENVSMSIMSAKQFMSLFGSDENERFKIVF
ncbi:hypothetical protein KUV86_00015 [Halomonas sp. DP8Y7-3]|uniref:colicin E5-related ribonuclease n=1 Tax=Halomonas sp. DP8Y7-3 TaxID=2859079 RepID=UPI001C9386F1|nr:colicin E5-related ribonuclease [Halomonas sp. DP8Y7-3]MBY5927494.1 hypothetical protein [Halomonas sp. DP8Y7-3]